MGPPLPSLTLHSDSLRNVDRVILRPGKANIPYIPSWRNRNLQAPASGVLWPTPPPSQRWGKKSCVHPLLLQELGSFPSSALPLECPGLHASAPGPACSLPLSFSHTLLLVVFQYAALNAFLPTQMLLQAGGTQSDSAELSPVHLSCTVPSV